MKKQTIGMALVLLALISLTALLTSRVVKQQESKRFERELIEAEVEINENNAVIKMDSAEVRYYEVDNADNYNNEYIPMEEK